MSQSTKADIALQQGGDLCANKWIHEVLWEQKIYQCFIHETHHGLQRNRFPFPGMYHSDIDVRTRSGGCFDAHEYYTGR